MSTVIVRRSEPTRLTGVTYDMYAHLRDHRGNRGLRMTYYNGVLEIMSPLFSHERNTEHLAMIVRAVAIAFRLPFIGGGSTTFRQGRIGPNVGAGKEPNCCFYFAHETLVRDKTTIDLTIDPPPDLWIEVDHRGSSRGRLPLYAALGIPEIWQYRVRSGRLRFLRLNNTSDAYETMTHSLSLPMLSPELVRFALNQGQGKSDMDFELWLRQWAAGLTPQGNAP